MRFLRVAVLLFIVLPLVGSLWTPTGDGVGGWLSGEHWSATNVNELEAAVDDTATDSAALGVYAHDYTPGSSTGGIQEAVDACGEGANSYGCTVWLDRGLIDVTAQIVIGDPTDPTHKQNNITIRGQGGNSGGFGENATRIRYTGASAVGSGTAVFRISGFGHELYGFGIYGNSTIDSEVIWEGNSDGGGTQTIYGKLTRLHIEGHARSGIRLKTVGGGANDQVDFIRMTEVTIEDNDPGTSTGDYCIEIDVPLTSMNKLDGVSCGAWSIAGIRIVNGSFDVQYSTFANSAGDCQNPADCWAIKVENDAIVPQVSIMNNHFEVGEGGAIKGPGGTDPSFTQASIIDNSILISEAASRTFLQWDNVGRLTVIGNQWTNGVPIGTGADGDRTFSIQCDVADCTGSNADGRLLFTWLGNSIRAYGTGTITNTVDITDPIDVEP